MRKGLTLKMVGGVILAIIGVAVLIGVFTGSIGGIFEDTFCTTYGGLAYIMPGQESPSPAGCGESSIDYKEVKTADRRDFTLKLASAVINCWQKYQGYRTERESCEGWNVQNLDGRVSRDSLIQIMRENNLVPNQIDEEKIVFEGGASDGIESGLVRVLYTTSAGGDEKIEVR